MAFVSRVGNMLKQTISNHVKLELAASKPSVYQAIRCMSLMSSSKVFVGGFPYSTDEMSLRETFAQYGEVVEARIVTDRETGRSRGFAFVSYTSNDEASSAIQALDGKDFQGRMLRVNYAAEKSRTGFGSGGYGNSGSSYGASGDYGGGTSFTSIYGNYTGGGSGYGGSNYGNNAGVNSLGGTTGTTFGNQGGRIGNEDFDQDVIEENNKVNNHEVHEIDYANTRG